MTRTRAPMACSLPAGRPSQRGFVPQLMASYGGSRDQSQTCTTHQPDHTHDLPHLWLCAPGARAVTGRAADRGGIRRSGWRPAGRAGDPTRAGSLRHDTRPGSLRSHTDQAHSPRLDSVQLLLVSQRRQPHDDGEPPRHRSRSRGDRVARAWRSGRRYRLQRRHAARRLQDRGTALPRLRPFRRGALRDG
jgi:hypothetical protein